MSVKVLTERDRAAITQEIEDAVETVTETVEDTIRKDMTVELSHVWEAIAEIRAALCGFNQLLNGETPAFKESIPYVNPETQGFTIEDRGEPRPWIDSVKDKIEEEVDQ
jgi:hypothetical protein